MLDAEVPEERVDVEVFPRLGPAEQRQNLVNPVFAWQDRDLRATPRCARLTMCASASR